MNPIVRIAATALAILFCSGAAFAADDASALVQTEALTRHPLADPVAGFPETTLISSAKVNHP